MAGIEIKNEKGFTLIEILVVLAIAAVLSLLAVNGYTDYRKSTLIDLSADNFVSQVYEMRDKTSYGDFGGEKFEQIKGILSAVEQGEEIDSKRIDFDEGDAKCYGAYFLSDEIGFSVQSFEQDFENKKQWDPVLERFVYVGCGDFDVNKLDSTEFNLDEMVTITKILFLDDQGEVSRELTEDFFIRFMPPDGELQLSEDVQQLQINMQYADDPDFQRKVIFDVKNSNFSVIQ